MTPTTRRTPLGPRSTAEWVAFAISVLILGSVVASIATLWIGDRERPAQVRVDLSAPRAVGQQFSVRATVVNTGDRTAAAVQVTAELSRDGEVVEEGEQQIDFLAGGSSAELEFLFTEDPAQGELVIRPASFTRP